MATFKVPSLSDDELLDSITSAERGDKKTLFERRDEFKASSGSQHTTSAASTSAAGLARLPEVKAVNTESKSISADPPFSSSGHELQKSAAGSSSSTSPYRILVNKKQKGNPVLKCIHNVPWEYDSIIPDYELGRCACALYLTVKYHNRFPEYIHNRLKELGKSYELRIILLLVDTKQQDISHELNQLTRICILADCTLILAFSVEEAGRYLELYKSYENKPPTELMGKTKSDFLSQATEFLTCVKGVNKTDVTSLLSRFKTLRAVINADVDSLSMCPGIGPVKARRLHSAFTTSFLKRTASKRAGNVPTGEMELLEEDWEDCEMN